MLKIGQHSAKLWAKIGCPVLFFIHGGFWVCSADSNRLREKAATPNCDLSSQYGRQTNLFYRTDISPDKSDIKRARDGLCVIIRPVSSGRVTNSSRVICSVTYLLQVRTSSYWAADARIHRERPVQRGWTICGGLSPSVTISLINPSPGGSPAAAAAAAAALSTAAAGRTADDGVDPNIDWRR